MHFYCAKTGEPRYKIPYANGKGEKTPTLADAKRCGFVPSVTSVLQILDRPGLNRWQQEQMILAALTHPGLEGMTGRELLSAVRKDAEAEAKAAADEGTRIHKAIEEWVSTGHITPYYKDHVNGFVDALHYHCDHTRNWQTEVHIPTTYGYGGRADIFNDHWLLDVKTKEFTQEDIDAGKVKGWPEQEVQLTAYNHALGGRRKLANVLVSRTVPGLVYWHTWPPEGYDAALRKWLATLEVWFAWKDPDGKLREHLNEN